jgi:hypothetical protein
MFCSSSIVRAPFPPTNSYRNGIIVIISANAAARKPFQEITD